MTGGGAEPRGAGARAGGARRTGTEWDAGTVEPVGEPAMFEVALPGAAVRFTTRLGGVSEGPYGSLNLGIQTDDDPVRVVENRRLLSAGVGLAPADVIVGRQVHGAEIARWGSGARPAFDDATGSRPEVDGHVTGERGLGLLVQVADCMPVALATPDRVAMLHCGWRGTAAGIVARAVDELRGAETAIDIDSGSRSRSRPGGEWAAAVGPGIGRCCFEVGPEVVEAFADVPDAVDPPRGRADGGMLDLRRVVEARLRAAGVEQVEHVDLCTHCRDDLFFSHRRDGGVTGRQCGIVWRT